MQRPNIHNKRLLGSAGCCSTMTTCLAGSFFELLIKRGSNIAITNLTKKSTVNGTVVTMEVGNFWCLLLRKCIYR